MYISAFLHRQELFEITERWLSDALRPEDALQITRILTYDSFIAWHTALEFVQSLNRRLGHPKALQRPLYRKRDLKDFITAETPPASGRIGELIASYRRMPEFFYVGSPMAGYLFHDREGRALGVCRFKRVKRIAEKASRYAALFMYERVRRQSEALMRDAGTPLSPEAPLTRDLLAAAERRIILHIRREGLELPARPMTIRDVVGAKIVDRGFGPEGLAAAIADMPRAAVVDREDHRGNYNAIHYNVRLAVDPAPVVAAFDASPHRTVCRRRGLAADGGTADFEAFIEGGADDLSLDLILTTPEELLESEIGRSMHETRIFHQRQEGTVYGNIPVNIEYIIEYLLAVGLSPVVAVDEIPIKIWGRYLPDTLSYCIRNLYGIPEFSLLDA